MLDLTDWVVRFKLADGSLHPDSVPFSCKITKHFGPNVKVKGYQLWYGQIMIYEENFKGGPFVMWDHGGKIDLDLGKLTFADIKIEDILAEKEKIKRRKYRGIHEEFRPAW